LYRVESALQFDSGELMVVRDGGQSPPGGHDLQAARQLSGEKQRYRVSRCGLGGTRNSRAPRGEQFPVVSIGNEGVEGQNGCRQLPSPLIELGKIGLNRKGEFFLHGGKPSKENMAERLRKGRKAERCEKDCYSRLNNSEESAITTRSKSSAHQEMSP